MKNQPAAGKPVSVNPSLQHQPAGSVQKLTEVSVQHFTGPMPHPDIVQGYESVCPGAAERIIRNFELEAEHRRSMDRNVLEAEVAADIRRSREHQRGQYCALAVATLALLAAVALGVYNQQWAAAIVAAVGVGSIVAAFLRDRKADPENGQKSK